MSRKTRQEVHRLARLWVGEQLVWQLEHFGTMAQPAIRYGLSNQDGQSETKGEYLNWSATNIQTPDMSVEEHIKAGQLDEALAQAQEAVRKTPAEARPRILLFQLFSVLGQWERALTQLNVLRDMDPECMVLAEIFRPVLQFEALREEIFAGNRTPLLSVHPAESITSLIPPNPSPP